MIEVPTTENARITIPLGTLITCPIDSSHRFPLYEGLSRSSIEELRSAARTTEEALRTRIASELQRQHEHHLTQEKDRLVKSHQEEKTAFEVCRAEQEASLQEMRRSLQKQRLAELQIKHEFDELKAAQELAIANALREQREKERHLLRNEIHASMQAEIGRIKDASDLKVRELEQQRDTARRAVQDLERKIAQGSMQAQGEALEIEIEETLRRHFPLDQIYEVAKGVTGADVIQDIRLADGTVLARISYECKNAKSWSTKWIEKAKADQIGSRADITVIITSCLPDGVEDFVCRDGVWIASLRVWRSLVVVLRTHLIQLFHARASAEGRDAKLSALHEYLVGPEFRNRVELMMTTFAGMQVQIEKERRVFQKHWALRERQVLTVQGNLSSLFGGLQGIVGESALPAPETLCLEQLIEQ